MAMNYEYYPESIQYSNQAVTPMWDYPNDFAGTDPSFVNAQQFWGFGPFFGPFGYRRFGFFGPPFFYRRPFWGWGGWW